MTTIPLPPKNRKYALVAIGDGLGNVIQQTPLLVAASQWFENVDLWLPRSPQAYGSLLVGALPNLRRVMCGPDKRPTRKYDAAFSTWLVRDYRKRMSAEVRFSTGSPASLKTTESDAAIRAIKRAGWEGETPRPLCNTSKPRFKIPKGTLVGVTTGSRSTIRWMAKRYSGDSYADAFDIVMDKYPDINFLHVGTHTDSDIKHRRVIDIRSKLPLIQTAGAIAKCAAFVGNDTGLCHVAAALNVPTTVVFGPTIVRKNLPPFNAKAVSLGLVCQPCQSMKPKRWRRMPGKPYQCKIECLRDLPPSLVADSILESLDAA